MTEGARAGLILVAQAAGAFGVKGEMRITAFTADPASLLRYRTLMREDGSAGLTLTSGRVAGGALIARAREVATREEAQALRGLRLYIERASLPEPEDDEYYLADLIGLAVRSPAGEAMGTVKSVNNFGAGDLLEIAPADGAPSWWAPFTREAVPEVRPAEGWLIIDRPPETEGRGA
ncbi:MAG TPA: ribosome maturation factor RimM [Caulobacteraceae bacterium]|nr:ribosome maturation factor RimM [Caulobacteraceae bacterium]